MTASSPAARPASCGRTRCGAVVKKGTDTGLALLAVLQQDGRASHAEPAAATGWSPATVGRRPDELPSSGALFFDADLDDTLLARTPATTSRPSSPRPPGRPASSPRPGSCSGSARTARA
ncbi:AsnC family protein [Streptomyces sp. NPDC005485]|uniref:AsnC family protein n=1 Tax=Streptomyces sp. NPDC005485 TaxID=3155591 RepID=UPI0033A060F7